MTLGDPAQLGEGGPTSFPPFQLEIPETSEGDDAIILEGQAKLGSSQAGRDQR